MSLPYRSTRRDFLRMMGMASVSSNVFGRSGIGKKAPEKSSAANPNVVFIMADDMGWGDVEAYNPESLTPTPHIDRLAKEGVRFSDAHSCSALCTPTRYGILTGRFLEDL